ncbi:alpha/beta hydrolase-fold protein [Stenotrophomonas sp. MMGLT7]|uniref:alpha/beta hydrolase n=1 Tax=Stenotrophomonas sp. MMGLT7 TaxID=2901227 RepID=UPI001E47A2C3|nr:alpha/beta hydrolase-fold protein [Stenotrophomonas sp. MMGLT7]MCD7100042.1 prolyl oligopeptidase family serine peptidase [Stenotrophomonas sp. MMGLT7]
MKKLAIVLSFLLASPLAPALAAPAAPALAPAPEAPAAAVQVAGTQQWDMRSPQGRDYRIFLYRPDGAAPPDGYPVLYVLDGNAMFLTAVETVQAIARRPDAGAVALPVIVGIGYPDGTDVRSARVLDLTPVAARNPQNGRMSGGGADAFADFIQHAVEPAVAGRVPVDRERQALFGHSFGGLFVLHVLATRPQAFSTWLAASPSLWFGDGTVREALLQPAKETTKDAPPPRVLITVGEYERRTAPWAGAPGGDVAAADRQLQAMAQYENAQAVAAALASRPGASVELDLIPGEDHFSVVPAAIGRAVRFLLMPEPAAAR